MMRGWIKLHITCDVASHVITSVKITNENESDGRQFSELVSDARENVGKIGKIYGDTAYDSRANFNEAARIGAEPVIRPRINSTGRSKGSYIRAQTVREFLSDPEMWKKRHCQRWQVEAVFSSLKRMVGECFTSATRAGIFNEIMMKVLTYNMVEVNRNG